MASKSKPQLPFIFVAGGLGRATQFNLKRNFMDDYEMIGGIIVPRKKFVPLGEEKTFDPWEDKHKSTQIWLHGIGDTAVSIAHVFEDSALTPVKKSTRVRLITAPKAPEIDKKGPEVPSWFGIRRECSSKIGLYDIGDVERSSRLIRNVILEERKKLRGDSENIFLGGHSSGAAMALHIGMDYERPLGGIIGISGFKFKESKTNLHNKNIQILLTHGTKDETFPINSAETSYNENKWSENPTVKFHAFESMGHKFDVKVLDLFRDFMNFCGRRFY